ncbi:MAG: hypothetical protein JWP49_1704 [Phenylobacterium sp.]|nr:hypothetical protein [Phenylobacterium sp.]
MPKIDIAAAELRTGSRYPSPFDAPCRGKTRRQLGDVAGLSQFGVNLLRLPPGQWSAQRHWHTAEDEFIWVVEGEVVLVTDAGEEVLRVGDCAGFKAGVPDGHHLQNRSSADAVVLEVGTRDWKADACDYPDIDMQADEQGYLRRDGTRYPER